MEVTSRTHEHLSHYLQKLVNFSDPSLMVRSEHHDGGVALMVVRTFPEAGVRLLLSGDFIQGNQDARVLEVIGDWVKHWLSRGLPEVQGDQYTTQTVTAASHGTS